MKKTVFRLGLSLPSLLLAAVFSLLCTAGCGKRDSGDAERALPFSPYVEAFTTGKISRATPVYLIFAQDVAESDMTPEKLEKAMSIKPAVKGEFSFENAKTIVFKPVTEFERGRDYNITVDLSQFFDVEAAGKDFTFGFATFPMSLRASLASLDVNNGEAAAYDVTVDIYTADSEAAEILEPLLKVSEKGAVSWEHAADGKKHTMKISGVEAGRNGVRTMTVSVAANKLGTKKEDILSVYIPGKDDFGIYDAVYVSDPERYVEVTFSKLLDPEQSLAGLAYISGNSNETVTVDGNKLRLYPDAGSTGTASVHLDASIRSKEGTSLGKDITREVETDTNVPAVQFIGDGVVIPQSSQLLVPFHAVYLKGVVVRIIRVMEQNIGLFLQVNRLDGSNELIRAGRIVARKTVFIDDQGQDLSKWGTYAVDLTELIEPEPGAIYRVELSFNRDLSAYPCVPGEGAAVKTKEQIQAEDEVKFREEQNSFDEGGYYYYYYNDFDWSDYNYRDRNDPCTPSFYSETNTGRNVLATNLGLMAKMGESGEMLVSVHNLLTAMPENGVDVKVYNYQNQVMGGGTTAANGEVRIDVTQGRPYYIIASQGGQRSYLHVDQGASLSLSSFDVAGEVVRKGLKGFIYGDRGVWRPGDTLFLGFMLNDRAGTLPADHPVVMELYNPLGQMYLKKTQTRGAMGLYAFEMPTEQDSPTGAWEARVNVGGTTFTKSLRIESIKPNRLKIDLGFDREILLGSRPAEGKMHVEWLQGATARNLKYEIDGSLTRTATSFPKFNGFVFDDPAREFSPEEERFDSGTTDENGDAVISGQLGFGDSAPGMLTATFNTRVYEESGDFSIDALRIPFSPYERYAGIRYPQTDKRQLDTGKKHEFEVASVRYDGSPVSGTELEVTMYKMNWYWWWSSDYNRIANYISDYGLSPERSFTVTTKNDGKVTFDVEFTNDQWGTYYISVRDGSGGHSTGIMAYFDWPGWDGRRDMEGSDAATKLTFKTDKDTYAPGEKMTVTLPSGEGSRAVVSIENGSRVLSMSEHACKSGETSITLDVTEDMQPNAYVYITLLQPHGATLNDLPIRLYGVQPVTVTSPKSTLHPELKAPDEIKPEAKYEIVVSEKDGREMAYTIAIVDEGLLDLTRFKTPDPWKAFNGREALGVTTWDMYNMVVGAYGGRIEQLFSIGGDDALAGGPKAIVNRFKPVVRFDGPFLLKKDRKQKHTYEMPNYNGRVRMMVVAGDGKSYGSTEKSVMVQKPVMLLGTLPRVIGTGEEMVVPAAVFATEKNVGDVEVSVSVSDNMQVMGQAKQTLNFSDISDKSAFFRIKTGKTGGAGKVVLTAVSKNDRSVYETDIEIRTVRRPQTKVIPTTLTAGQAWSQVVEMPGMDGTNKLSLEVSDVQPVNLTERLGFLLGYPHGCIEQITSKGFPQLYLTQFASLTGEQAQLAEESVKEVIRRQRSYQIAEGGFSYWPGGTGSNAWGTVYAVHFQIEAEAKGFVVPGAMKNAALDNLKLVARNWKQVDNYYSRSEQLTQAYRLYVLALAKSPELGAMNRLHETKELDPTTRWTLAAAYAAAGRTDVAKELTAFTGALEAYNYDEYDYTFGSDMRDKAIRLIALTLTDDAAQAAALSNEISKDLSSDDWYSTQSTGFALVALSQYMNKYKVSDKMEFGYAVADNKSVEVATDKNIWSEMLLEKSASSARLEVKNSGASTLFVRVITEGTPEQSDEQAYANGLAVDVSYRDMGGKLLDIADLEQGTNFTATVTVKNPTAKEYNNIVLTQIFPAGWEILNTRFTAEGASDSYPAGVNYQDIRDDRVYSYMDVLPSGREITVTMNLAAVYEGTFYLPPVYAEAMYDNLIRANTEGKNVEVRR